MNPIFSYVDPILLFKEIPSYEYLLFILYKHENNDFREQFRQSMGRYHVDSGKNIGLFVFDFPNDKWFQQNFSYFLKRYRSSSTHEDWRAVMTEVTKSNRDRLLWLKEFKKDDYCSSTYMNRFMEIFSINDSNLPALVIFIKNQPTVYYLGSNIGIGHVDGLLYSLTSQDNYKFNHSDLHRFPENTNLPQIVEMLNGGFSSEYWKIVQSIHCLQLQKDKGREPIKGLIGAFPEFKELKYPDYFEWHKDLIKCLKKYNSFVGKFVEQLNVLIDNPGNRGLGLEKISNFWRFRINNKYRSHYFELNGKKVCYFLGYHDYQL